MVTTVGISGAQSSKRRIGLVGCETAYPPTRGNAVHIYQLWHRLQAIGYEVHTWGEQAVPGRIEYARTEAGLARLLKNVDALYVRFPFESDFSPVSAMRLLLKRRLPMICEFNAPLYEFTRDWPPRTLWTMRHKAILYARNHILVRACVDHAICVSNVMARYVRREFGIRDVSVLCNGGDPELFNPRRRAEGRAAMGVKEDDFVVFWGGWTAMPWQGVDQVIAAARNCDGRQIRFAMAGDPAYLPNPLPKNIMLLGQLNYSDMPRAIAGADVCLCLYRDYDWCRIGFYGSSLKLFEYMASGRALIATDIGQIRQIIRDGENGFLTDGSPEDILEKIELLRRDPAKREAMGRAARQTVLQKYNWQNVARGTDSILSGLLQRPDAVRSVSRRATK